MLAGGVLRQAICPLTCPLSHRLQAGYHNSSYPSGNVREQVAVFANSSCLLQGRRCCSPRLTPSSQGLDPRPAAAEPAAAAAARPAPGTRVRSGSGGSGGGGDNGKGRPPACSGGACPAAAASAGPAAGPVFGNRVRLRLVPGAPPPPPPPPPPLLLLRRQRDQGRRQRLQTRMTRRTRMSHLS